MKLSALFSLFALINLYHLNAQVVVRKDAADALNFIDNLTVPLKPAANNLVAYFHKLNGNANTKNNYKLPIDQIDSLQKYYNILITEYDKAINAAKQNKSIDKFQGLESNLLKLLNEGRKPWATVITVYLIMFSKGKSYLNSSEQRLVAKREMIFKTSAEETLEWAKVVAIQLDQIEKKYHLEFKDDLYK